ncbi:MAG: hypothetical protein NTX03_05020 [Bacteroidetes bacterium]|nr:hypothetical protein [Bacteroidota bacterium]
MAKIISQDEADGLNLTPQGKKNKIRLLILSLNVGQILYISRAEFTWKGRSPSLFCNALEKEGKGKFEVFKDEKKGWVVKRVE